jgi:predicted site-specific integrase-resolvase
VAGIKISEVQERWRISRPTIMKAVKNGKLSGNKDEIGRWLFAIEEVVR